MLLLNLADHQLERLGHVLAVASARLGPRTLVAVRQGLALLRRHLSLLGAQVGLVANEADRDAVEALLRGGVLVEAGRGGKKGGAHQVVEDLLADDLHHLKRRKRRH